MAGPVSRVIPREELSEFQRWQFNSLLEGEAFQQAGAVAADTLPSLDSLPANTLPEPDLPVVEPEPVAEESVLPFPTAEEIEAIEQQAREEGFQSGLLAGRMAAENEINRLRVLLSGVADACQAAEVQLASDVLDLALTVARQLVRDELSLDRTLMLPAIREAISGLPPVKAPARLVLNPEDLTAISSLLAGDLPSEYWRFVPDPSLSSGSCRIESAVSSVNLGMAERWLNILSVLGKKERSDLTWGHVPQQNGPDDDSLA